MLGELSLASVEQLQVGDLDSSYLYKNLIVEECMHDVYWYSTLRL